MAMPGISSSKNGCFGCPRPSPSSFIFIIILRPLHHPSSSCLSFCFLLFLLFLAAALSHLRLVFRYSCQPPKCCIFHVFSVFCCMLKAKASYDRQFLRQPFLHLSFAFHVIKVLHQPVFYQLTVHKLAFA